MTREAATPPGTFILAVQSRKTLPASQDADGPAAETWARTLWQFFGGSSVPPATGSRSVGRAVHRRRLQSPLENADASKCSAQKRGVRFRSSVSSSRPATRNHSRLRGSFSGRAKNRRPFRIFFTFRFGHNLTTQTFGITQKRRRINVSTRGCRSIGKPCFENGKWELREEDPDPYRSRGEISCEPGASHDGAASPRGHITPANN